MYATDLHKHKEVNCGRGSVVKIEVGSMYVQVQQPPIVWEQPLVQQQPVVQEPALRTPNQRPALRILEENPKLYILLYRDGEMATPRASRPGVPLWNYGGGRFMQERAVTVFCVYDDTFETLTANQELPVYYGDGSNNRGRRQRRWHPNERHHE
jgi:hypothetical protein